MRPGTFFQRYSRRWINTISRDANLPGEFTVDAKETLGETPEPRRKRHPGLAKLFRYPLMSAIAERRSRRISRGMSLNAAGLSHASSNAPAPLSPLEEAVLVVSTGLTGATMHDGPLETADGGK